MPVIDINHPLVRHKVGLLREDDISTKKFRELTNEIARLLAYEATADFPLEKTTIAVLERPGRNRTDRRTQGDGGADPARRAWACSTACST